MIWCEPTLSLVVSPVVKKRMPAAAASSPQPFQASFARAQGGHWFWGHGPDFATRPLAMLEDLRDVADVVRTRMGPVTVFVVNHPELVWHVLSSNRVYTKNTLSYVRLRQLIGLGLITSDGDFWLRQRRIAQPAFHKQKIAGFASIMTRAAEAAAERISAANGKPIDVCAEMTRATLSIVCDALLGGDVGSDGETIGSAFTVLNQIMIGRLIRPIPTPSFIPTAENRRFRANLRLLDDTVYRIIARRRAQPEASGDLLSMLLHARDEETGQAMTDQQLRDEVITILLAGHETTAVTLAWCLYLLSQHPEVENKLRAELTQVLGGRTPELADVEKLRYTRMVLEETLRLYPPVWILGRGVASDDTLGGHKIPRGGNVIVSPWALHRSPSLWEAPNEFRPERFEAADSIPRGAYFPFAGGPRQCVGNNFALLEGQLILAILLQRFRLSLAPGHEVELEPLLTLRPRGSLPMIAFPT
jgi:cytochrome P450